MFRHGMIFFILWAKTISFRFVRKMGFTRLGELTNSRHAQLADAITQFHFMGKGEKVPGPSRCNNPGCNSPARFGWPKTAGKDAGKDAESCNGSENLVFLKGVANGEKSRIYAFEFPKNIPIFCRMLEYRNKGFCAHNERNGKMRNWINLGVSARKKNYRCQKTGQNRNRKNQACFFFSAN